LLFERGGSETAGFGFGGTTSGGMPALGYTWNNNQSQTYNFNSQLFPQLNIWQFVALVVRPGSATFYLYYPDPVTGEQHFLSAVQTRTLNNMAFNGSGGGTILLGGDSTAANRTFPGSIASAAVYNSSLSAEQILQLYGAGLGVQGFKPAIAQMPASRNVYEGMTVSLTASGIGGTLPIGGYQWQLNNTNLSGGNYAGVNTNTLTISNIVPVNAGPYTLVVTNVYGVTTSSVPTIITIVPPPSTNLVGHWLTTASLADTSGFTPGGIHDGYGVGPAGTNYVFTNDVPPNMTGQSLWLYGNTAIAISNSATVDGTTYTNTYDDGVSNSVTIMVWAKGWPGSWNPWVSKYGETGTRAEGWQVRTFAGGPNAVFTMRGTGATDDPQGNIGSNDGKWHNYAATYDAVTGIRTLYVDGKVANRLTGNGPYALARAEHLTIGGRDQPEGNNFTAYFSGEIYDVRIYTAALTQNQIGTMTMVAPPVSTTVTPGTGGNPGQLVVTWPFGSLLEATNVAGPWITNATAASPYTINMTNSAEFFKVQNP
jgi:hypothetical protein